MSKIPPTEFGAELVSLMRTVLDEAVERISQEHSELADRHDLKREPQPVVVPTSTRYQLPVFVIEVEEAFQLNTGQRPKPAVAALIGHAGMKSRTAQRRSMFACLRGHASSELVSSCAMVYRRRAHPTP